MSELEKLSSEQAADLAALTATAAEEAPAALPGQEQAAPVDNRAALADEIAGMLMAATMAIGPMLPSLKRIYTPETTAAVGSSVAAVCAKRGWLSGGLVGEYSEEFAATLIVVPLAIATVQGVKGDIAAIKEKTEAEKPSKVAAPQTVGAGVVTVPDAGPGAGVAFGSVQA